MDREMSLLNRWGHNIVRIFRIRNGTKRFHPQSDTVALSFQRLLKLKYRDTVEDKEFTYLGRVRNGIHWTDPL